MIHPPIPPNIDVQQVLASMILGDYTLDDALWMMDKCDKYFFACVARCAWLDEEERLRLPGDILWHETKIRCDMEVQFIWDNYKQTRDGAIAARRNAEEWREWGPRPKCNPPTLKGGPGPEASGEKKP